MAKHETETLKTLALQGINQGKKRTHTFNVDYTEYNEAFTGKFVVHHPSQMERLQIGVLKSQLLGGVSPDSVDVNTDNIAIIVATLDTVIDVKPNWFNPFSDELEYEIMESVYLEYINWINSFRRNNRKGNNEGDSNKQ